MNTELFEKMSEKLTASVFGAAEPERVAGLVKDTLALQGKLSVERDIAKTTVGFITDVLNVLTSIQCAKLFTNEDYTDQADELINNLVDENQLSATLAEAIAVVRIVDYKKEKRDQIVATVASIQRVMAAPTYRLVCDYIDKLLNDSTELRALLLDQLNGNNDPLIRYHTPNIVKN